MTTSNEPVYPLVVINGSGGPRSAQLLLSESDVFVDVDVVLNAEVIVDTEGRRVAVRMRPLALELIELDSPIPCGFCFERTWTPPRFPPRCDACAAENLCWSCRSRKAVAGVQPPSPLPRCEECRGADADFLALPAHPASTGRDRLVPLAWGVGVGIAMVIALRACG